MKHCDRCDLDFPEHFRFCGSCGGELKDIRKCPSCGELTESKWPFCTSCGSEFSSGAPQVLPLPASEVSASPIASTPTQVLEGPRPATEAPSRYSEPGELYDAGRYQQPTSDRSREFEGAPTSPLANSETVEVLGGSEKVAPVRAYQTRSFTVRHDQPQPATVAVPLHELKAAQTLSTMESYGRVSETPSQSRWWPGAVLALVVLVVAGGIVLGGWYLRSHRKARAQAAAVSPAPSLGSLSEEPSIPPSISPTAKSSKPADSGVNPGADDEFRSLQNQRTSAQPSDNSKLAGAYADAEKKYPNDYRFPYERAKLSIVGVATHHEAFGALASAAEKAIDNGKNQEMLESLMAHKDSDFYKLSHGHREWQILQEALRNGDKTQLQALRH